jgi:anti-sigma factor RsiW
MTTITRDVISDLWPVYASGEATEDTRALVESFLADNPGCAAEFEAPVALPAADAALAPDAEARALVRTKELMRGGRWLHGVRLVAVVLTVLALVRFYADTLEIFLVRLGVATIAWALFAVLVLRERRRAMRATTPPRAR